MDYEQSGEELAAQYGEGSAVECAFAWLKAILGDDGDLRVAWPLADPALRLALVRSWIWANRMHAAVLPYDRDELAGALAEVLAPEVPAHPLWMAFEATQLDEFRERWSNLDLDRWGFASRPRPIAVDYELVLFVEGEGAAWRVERETFVNALPLLMHSTPDGWRVAGFSEEPPDSGWPET